MGFEFTGDPLLEGDFLPLRQGLTVLYGLNGAGKTRLLRGIRAALLGIADDVELGMIVRAELPVQSESWSAGDEERRPVGVALAQAMMASGMHGAFGFYGDSPAEKRMSSDDASDVVSEYIRNEAGDADPDLSRELQESRLFLLMPTGSAGHPSWDAWGVADLSLPAATRVRGVLHDLMLEWDAASDEDYDQAFEEWDEKVRPHAIFGPEENRVRARRRTRYVRADHFSPYNDRLADGEYKRGFELQGDIDFGLDLLELSRNPAEATADYLGSIVATLCEGIEFADHDKPESTSLFSRTPASTLAEAARALGRLEPALSARKAHRATDVDGLSALIEQSLRDVAAELTRYVNAALKEMLPEPPTATLRITPLALRFVSPTAMWEFTRADQGALSGSALRLEDLSRAERQWATRALGEALYWHRRGLLAASIDPLRPCLELIDEPESGLHRAAESRMAAALVDQRADSRRVIVAATHSPELLDARDSRPVEVQRGGGWAGRSLVHPLDLADRSALGRLGLNPSDLLRFTRIILLVEGQHDQTLLEAFVGDRLRRARVQIVPLHGGSKLASTVDSQVLFDHTRAHMVALIDNQRADIVTEVWQLAQEAAIQEDVEAAVAIVVDGIHENASSWKDSREEARFIRNWLTSALRKGLDGRISPMGLSAPDIIEYLPVARLVDGATSWEDLHGRHRAAREAKPNRTSKDFKTWLQVEFSADFRPAALIAAAEGLPVPQEFAELMDMLEARSAEQG